MGLNNIYSGDRIVCRDFLHRHKSRIFNTNKNIRFFKLDSLAHNLREKFKKKKFQSTHHVCQDCYRILKSKLLDSDSNNDLFSSESEEDEGGLECHDITETTATYDLEKQGDEYRPTTPVAIGELNETLISQFSSVSPLRTRSIIKNVTVEKYVSRKRKELISSFSEATSNKLIKIYHVNEDDLKVDEKSCANEWMSNISAALENCTSTSEKIRLLSVIPSSFTIPNISSSLSGVTNYMIKKSKKIQSEKGIYAPPEMYQGHPLSDSVKQIIMNYYLNDDFNCSVQSPNKSDVISVTENGIKIKKVKRFLTRSLKEIFELFRQENPNVIVSKSKFYSLRPKYVSISPLNQMCLCTYCANFELYLIGLKNFLDDSCFDKKKVETEILSAVVCSSPTYLCFLKECKLCPGSEAITLKLLKLDDIDESEEISFVTWNNGDLLKLTATICEFRNQLATWTTKMITHLYVKNIQRNAIKEEKQLAQSNPKHLIMHIDFAENWAVFLKNAVQGNHWKNDQVTIFTAVCYKGDTKKSFAVISDDLKHDSAHAFLAMSRIIDYFLKLHDWFDSITLLSDGAASHFKNRYQMNELKNWFMIVDLFIKWLFSGTGHGKGPVDAIGGIVKHFATIYNLQKEYIDSIQNAEDFVKKVQPYTPSIELILLKKDDVVKFRENKKKEWEDSEGYTGIQKSHVWYCTEQNDKTKLFVAATAEQNYVEVQQKKKRKNQLKTQKKKKPAVLISKKIKKSRSRKKRR